ncbi:MAG TPA: FlgD immunoglobulin-like domain containing protein [Candidatus Eisenbacteria bacterium]|nr:FlgD immunoglobulin-like domain containing protein [Candidatus Eisenbacteria bacterium]
MKAIRTFPALLACALLSLGAVAVRPAAAQPVPDSTALAPWRIYPPAPCVSDTVFMIVRGYEATPCDSFMSAEAVNPLLVRIRLHDYGDRRCFAAPSVFYPVPVVLGRFPAGTHQGIVEYQITTEYDDGSTTITTRSETFSFNVTSSCRGLPYVSSITTEPQVPCATRPTTLVMAGSFPDGCGEVIDGVVHDPGHVEITLKPDVLPDTACALVIKPWRHTFELGVLPVGSHRTDITLHVLRRNALGTGFDRYTYYRAHETWVVASCDTAPSPIPGPLPYVTNIRIGSGVCGEVCPYVPVQVRVSGMLPSDCFRFRKIEIIPVVSNTLNPPKPPIVRIIVDDGGCLGMPCSMVPVPFEATTTIDALYPGTDPLPIQLAQVTCSDTYPPGTLYASEWPLFVPPSCPDSVPCLTPEFDRPFESTCHATLSKTQPAQLTFMVRPSVALAGLQGEFKLNPATPFISKIEAIGHAAGMLLQWTPTAQGARFVLVAPSGAPIPPWIATVIGGGWPVLKVTVMATVRSDAPPIPSVTMLTTENLLGSDIQGNAVPVCPPPPCADLRIPPGWALICGENACDFNADNSQDIRDLVLMVHCINAEGPCPPDVGTRFDCDGDAAFGIPDVICCARNILQNGSPPGGGTRPEPRITLRFDDPVVRGQMVDLPVHITALNAIGGAVLTLQAPLDRYEVAGWSVDPPAGNWLTLHETRDGRIVLGMLDIRGGNELAVLDHSVFTLRLRLKPGAAPGGTVTAVEGAFSGPDGVTLEVDLGTPSQIIPGGVASVLGRNRPNPFSSETRFTLDVAEAGNAVVGIYDLRGRAVKVIHRGALAAGPQEFAWDGRDADGRAVPEGVYFYQASVGGKALARKLILRRHD